MIKINLLPARPRRAIPLPALPGLGILFGVLGILLIGGMGAYWYTLAQEASRLQAEIARAESELHRLKSAIDEGNRSKKEKEDLERRVVVIELIGTNQARPVHLLDTLVDTIPRELWLTGIEEKQRQLRLAGSAYSPIAVADFMSNLRGSGKFKDVDLLVSRQDLTKTPRLVTFEIVCSFGL